MGDDVLGTPDIVSNNTAEAAVDADVILLAVPSFAHEMYLKDIRSYIRPGTIIGALPGEGGFDLCVQDVLGRELSQQCTLFAMETLPWACRIKSYGSVVVCSFEMVFHTVLVLFCGGDGLTVMVIWSWPCLFYRRCWARRRKLTCVSAPHQRVMKS